MQGIQEGIHLKTPTQEYEDLAIDDVHCKIKKLVIEKGRMTLTLESEVFTAADAGYISKMQQQGDYCTVAIQSVPPEDMGTAH
jgi:hypothetical protein